MKKRKNRIDQGFLCPNCKTNKSEVVKTETYTSARRRLRLCFNCKGNFWTVEKIQQGSISNGLPNEVIEELFPEHKKIKLPEKIKNI